MVLNARGYCRLCTRQASSTRRPHQTIDVPEANRHGQQLFIADLFRQARPQPPPPPARATTWPTSYPVEHRQLALFPAERDFAAPRGRGLVPPLPDLADALDNVLAEYGARHGWSDGLQVHTRSAIRVLLAVQDTPGAPINATDAAAVTTGRGLDNLKSVLEILTAAGMLDDDRPSTLDLHFERHSTGLTEPMIEEFRTWFHAMRDGSTTPPRYRPRGTANLSLLVANAAPMLHIWANSGIRSLREIDHKDIVDTLPSDPRRRTRTVVALRQLFGFLKARKLVFVNPTTRLRAQTSRTQPLPIDLARLREALNSPRPARAALATLIAFHGLRVQQIRPLQLTDLRDGRLHLDRRTVLLAEPVHARLAAWLDERARRWPDTVNPHLFINLHTAVRTSPVSPVWISATIGISAQAIREDRILHEAMATAGDVRRLTDLFGLTIGGAERYTHTPEPPAS